MARLAVLGFLAAVAASGGCTTPTCDGEVVKGYECTGQALPIDYIGQTACSAAELCSSNCFDQGTCNDYRKFQKGDYCNHIYSCMIANCGAPDLCSPQQ